MVDYVSLPQPVVVAIESVLQLPIGIVVVVVVVLAIVVVATELVVEHLLLLETELVATAARIPEPNSPGLVAMAGLDLEVVERVRVIRRVVLERRDDFQSQWKRAHLGRAGRLEYFPNPSN